MAETSSGWVKINTDATIIKDLQMCAFGCVAQNARGQFLMAHTSKYRGVLNTKEEKTKGVKGNNAMGSDKELENLGL